MPASELTIVDRQRALFKWRRQQQSSYSYFASSFGDESNQPVLVAELQHQPTVHDYHGVSYEILGDLGNGWPDLAAGGYPPLGVSRQGEGECAGPAVDSVMGGGCFSPPARKERGSSSSKKRNVEETRGGKVGADATEGEVTQKKKMKGGAEEAAVQPKLDIQQSSSDGSGSSNRRGSFREGSKDDSKATQKPDYIHVRARRGQATDSHSLAERVRREKISERMKYLQDLVPGCNKITGKAGMLDEIINYVQCLQRQVEFLSMRLAAVNPRIDFNIDLFVNKEINSACSSRFPAVEMSLDAADMSYLQFNPLQHATTCSGLDMAMDPRETALRQSASSPVPDAFLDPCFDVHGSSFAWDTDIQSLCNVEFHQGRGFTLPFLSSHGNIIQDNP